MSIIWGAALTVSCAHTVEPAVPDVPAVEEPADTVRTRLHITQGADWCGVGRLDVLLYSAEGLQSLEKHYVADGFEEEIVLCTTAGVKECVVVANSTRDLGIKIMSRFDTMKTLAFEYEDEDPERPVMVAKATFTAGEDAGVTLVPFLCRVVIDEVSNAMDGWVLMEEPEVYLSEVNPEVEILQEKDFRPAATREEGPAAALPCDVGFFSQYPGTVLHFYPNDTPERVLGGWRTMLTFCCKVDGELIEETVALPPTGRNALIHVRVDMSSEKRLTFRF